MKKQITILTTTLVFGLLVAWQINVRKELQEVSSPDTINAVAIRVSEALNGNKKLREELVSLEQQRTGISESYDSKAAKDELLSKELEQLRVVTGKSIVMGPGVQVVLNEQIELTQLIDLINALKNIGAEAIAVNDTRIVATTPLTSQLITTPLTVKTIGNRDILYDSLQRRGGIIEQIGSSSSSITKSEQLRLPEVKE